MSARYNDKVLNAFFALLRAGLWEQGVRLAPFMPIDFAALFALAEEQSVSGLIAAGLEHVEDLKVPKQDVMPFMKRVVALESRNQAMNVFIAELVEKMRAAAIRPVLVKGQGVAQCYARPLWRAAGDVDFLLDGADYEKAKALLLPLAKSVDKEYVFRKHQGLTIGQWVVELHGTLHNNITDRINAELDAIQHDTFDKQRFRVWNNGDTPISLLTPDNDVICVFTHILQHFFRGGIGLRQICDWCRLLGTYSETLGIVLLEQRISQMRLMSEWKAFAAYAVGHLGFPKDRMPLFDDSGAWRRKANRINRFILKTGNFGYNRDQTYYKRYPYLARKTISFGRRTADFFAHITLFPLDSLRVFSRVISSGLRSAARGE